MLFFAVSPAFAYAAIYSHTEAVSNSGGNTVGQGGTVTTGDASASVHVTTTNGEGSSTVYIKTEANGEVHEETLTAEKKIDVSVVSTPAKTEVTVQRDSEPVQTTVSSAGAATSSASTTVALSIAQPQSIFALVSAWFGSLFGFFF